MNIYFLLYLGFIVFEYYSIIYLDIFLNKYSENYRNINPAHKKSYVVVNIAKAFILFVLSYLNLNQIINLFLYDEWDSQLLCLCGALYSSIDMVGIYMVKKMPYNTLFHHIVVQLLFFTGLFYSFNPVTITKLIVIYAIFSCFAYLVNFFLALRVFSKNKRANAWIAFASTVIYALCCLLNWSYQVYYLFQLSWLTIALYGTLLSVLVRDDLILMKYLYNYSNTQLKLFFFKI